MILRAATLAMISAVWTACVQPPLQGPAPDGGGGPAPDGGAVACEPTRALDLLFVVDNSGSMGDRQMALSWDLVLLLEPLRAAAGGLPDVHIGVTSTDLGVGEADLYSCEEVGGDAGRLLTGTCDNPRGVPYLVDGAPRGCAITRSATGLCEGHGCGAEHCAHELSAVLEIDEKGCPRCRNYAGETLEDAVQCIVTLGSWGCGMEQPLEAMKMALDANPENAGFERHDALLAVVFLTDEDDCSAADTRLYVDEDPALGPISSFRCFEHGITCDINDPTVAGPRTGCEPRAGGMLHPIERYATFWTAHKAPARRVVSVLAGPVTDTVYVDVDSDGAEVRSACGPSAHGTAIPAIRMRAFLEAVRGAALPSWAFGSVCGDQYAAPLQELGQVLGARLEGLECGP